MSNFGKAMQALRPGAQWVGGDGKITQWLDQTQTEPTQEEIDAEVARIEAEQEDDPYKAECRRRILMVADYPAQVNIAAAATDWATQEAQGTISAENTTNLAAFRDMREWIDDMRAASDSLARAKDPTYFEDRHGPAAPASVPPLVAKY